MAVVGAKTHLLLSALALGPNAEVSERIERAEALYQEERFDEALAELEAAYAMEPRPELLFAMGQAARSGGDCETAIRHYEQFIAEAAKETDRAVAQEQIDECRIDADVGPCLDVEPCLDIGPCLSPPPPPPARRGCGGEQAAWFALFPFVPLVRRRDAVQKLAKKLPRDVYEKLMRDLD